MNSAVEKRNSLIDVNVNGNYMRAMPQSAKSEPRHPQWGIREFADKLGITTRTARFYEDKGLLSPKRIGGARIFSYSDLIRAEKILRAKRLGFSLDDIKEVFDVTDGRIKDRVELLRRKANFERVIQSLRRRRKDIDIVSQDMADICEIITQNVENAPDSDGVFDLAADYEAVFRNMMADDDIFESAAQKYSSN